MKDIKNIISILITIVVSYILGWKILPDIIIKILKEYLPFIGNDISGWVETFLRLGCFFSYFSACLRYVEKKHILVITILEKRIPFYFDEGWMATVVPPPIIGGEAMEVREETIEGPDKKVSAQTRDKQEVSVDYASQVAITEPIRWFNTKKPLDAIDNRIQGQLRIVTGLFFSEDLEQLKGIVAGLLLGETYVVWRNNTGLLLKDEGGNIVTIKKDISHKEQEEIQNEGNPTLVKCLMNFLTKSNLPIDGYFREVILQYSFRPEALVEEASSVGATIRSVTIKDITPPEIVRKAGAEAEKERLQADARKIETTTHRNLALMQLGYDPEKENISSIMRNWDSEEWSRYESMLSTIRVLEKDNSSSEIIVRHTGNNSGGGTALGDSVVAASLGGEK